MIINKLNNGYHINIDEANILSKYDNTVFAFMSPNDISKLEDDLEELLKSWHLIKKCYTKREMEE